MLKYEVGPFKKPNGLLMDKTQKRLTPKSAFLKKVERKQRDLAEAAHIALPTGAGKSGKVKGLSRDDRVSFTRAEIRAAIKSTFKPPKVSKLPPCNAPEPTNRERRVTQLRLAWNRKRDQ